MIYAFWNNKGGTGKTSLSFQTITRYAEEHLEENILVIDLCPQANLSEIFLGGLVGNGSSNLNSLYGEKRTETKATGQSSLFLAHRHLKSAASRISSTHFSSPSSPLSSARW